VYQILIERNGISWLRRPKPTPRCSAEEEEEEEEEEDTRFYMDVAIEPKDKVMLALLPFSCLTLRKEFFHSSTALVKIELLKVRFS
jgi:hypothetical protein